MQAQALLDSLRSLPLCANDAKLLLLDEYVAAQANTRDNVGKPGIEAVVEKLRHLLEAVCAEAQYQRKLFQVRRGGRGVA